jgi:hypothetical protein
MATPKLTILLSGMIAGVPHQGVQLGLSCNTSSASSAWAITFIS